MTGTRGRSSPRGVSGPARGSFASSRRRSSTTRRMGTTRDRWRPTRRETSCDEGRRRRRVCCFNNRVQGLSSHREPADRAAALTSSRHRQTARNRSSPSALAREPPRSRRDGGHDGRPGEHPRGDIPAVGRLPRQVAARGASKTRARASRSFPPERHRTSTVENATIFERSSSPRACLDPAERALTVPDPFDTRRARSNLTSCTSSCDSPPPSASTAFRMVRTPARERCRPEIHQRDVNPVPPPPSFRQPSIGSLTIAPSRLFPRRSQTSRRTSRCATSWRRSRPRCPRTTDRILEPTDPPRLTPRGGDPRLTPTSPTGPFATTFTFAIAARGGTVPTDAGGDRVHPASFRSRLSDRNATPVGSGGFDLYERGVDAVHVATARWSPATSVSMHRSPSPAARRSPYSPAFAAGLRAASAPPRDRPATHRPATHRPATHRPVTHHPASPPRLTARPPPSLSGPETTRKPRTWRAFAARGRTLGANRREERAGRILSRERARVGGRPRRLLASLDGRAVSRRPGEGARRAAAVRPGREGAGGARRRRRRRRRAQGGGADGGGAIETEYDGWPIGRRRVAAAARRFESPPQTAVRRHPDAAGEGPLVTVARGEHRAVAGE